MADYSWDGMKRKFRSRAGEKARNNLGVIDLTANNSQEVFRDKKLDLYDAYYENRQYKHLPPWDSANLNPRQKCPRLKMAFAKTLAQRLTSKLVGASVFPTINIPDSPDDQEFLRAILRESKLRAAILEPTRKMINTGSILFRYYLDGGAIKSEFFDAKYCYPEFQANGELEMVTIKYVFTDEDEKDALGNFVKKWFKLDLMMDREILYDEPEYKQNEEPEFKIESEVIHDLGFVQAEWMRTCDLPNSIDGFAMVADLTEFIDEMNYSLSQSSNAISFNQDPQLTFKGMTEDELNDVVKSSMKSWNLGLKGEAGFLESNLAGVQRAMEMRDKVRLNLQDISRIVLLDPDKIVGSAQSAKAMEVLHGPLKDLVDELRTPMEGHIKKLIQKMALTILIANSRGIPVPINIPQGYKPLTLDFEIEWPPIFQQTMEDLQKKVQVVSAATSSNLISRETGTKYLAKDFGVDNVEEEIAKIAAQPVINPFGGF